MMLSTTVSSFIFILASSLLGMPISTTHSDVGALVGAGLAGVGAENLSWKKVEAVVSSWIISPLVSGTLSGLLFTLLCIATLSDIFSISHRLINFTLISGISFGVTGFMVMGLVVRNTKLSQVYIEVIVCVIVGIICSRLLLLHKSKRN